MRRWTGWCRAGLALLLVGGCGNDDSDTDDAVSGTPGELNVGEFVYACVGTTDAACVDGLRPAEFPRQVAVGSSFAVGFSSSAAGTAILLPGSEEMFLESNGLFTARTEGVGSVIAASDGEILDWLHVEAVPLSTVVVLSNNLSVDRLELIEGEVVTLRGRPLSAVGGTLAGALPFVWTLEDSPLAQFNTSRTDNTVEFEALFAGATSLRLTVGAHEVVLPVLISPLDPPARRKPPGATGEPPETATDGDTDTDTDTDTDGSDTDGSDTDAGTGSGTGGRR